MSVFDGVAAALFALASITALFGGFGELLKMHRAEVRRMERRR